MRHSLQWWPTAPILSVLVIPAMAFDDTAFCQQITELAAEANADKSVPPDILNRDGDMMVDCARKTVRFKKSVAFSYSELGDTWPASKQQEWNSVYCLNREWAPIFASGWKVSMTVHTFDGKSVEFFAQCIR